MYGDQTNSNALVNEWLPGVGTVILNLVSWQLTWRRWSTLANPPTLQRLQLPGM